ncbi:uncharacterized protein LOC114715181 [Neltuma alba]|uniref:uncharacterized protein LOC114715181 n=1 Tax=Neltuma alba TaxID=207710 RepID=UPI0010A4E382|nr:uncharacterized protein LOC114715181 [Prosopis alba]
MGGEKDSGNPMIDFASPLFLHPSDTQGTSIIGQILTGSENYTIWSKSMMIALRGKNKVGFIDGSCKKEEQDLKFFDHWERCNAVVLSWILGSVSKDLASSLVYFQDAHTAWADLKERFDKISGSRIFYLYQEIHSLRQGKLTVFAYYSRLKELWEE